MKKQKMKKSKLSPQTSLSPSSHAQRQAPPLLRLSSPFLLSPHSSPFSQCIDICSSFTILTPFSLTLSSSLSFLPFFSLAWRGRETKKNHRHQMGSGISRTGSRSGSYSRAGPRQVPRPTMRRSISSVLICGGASSSSTEVSAVYSDWI